MRSKRFSAAMHSGPGGVQEYWTQNVHVECGNRTTVLSCDVKPLPATVERCGDGIDNDCDGSPNNGFDTGADCTVGVGACATSGKKVCAADGLGTECNATAGASSVEVCDGIDNDCDGEADDGLECGPRGGDGGGGGGPGPPSGPDPEKPGCPDSHGQPVSAASGSMFFGPIPLAVIATPTGMPLAASLTYSSMKPDGKFGKGWTMSWEGSARLDGARVVVRTGTGATLVFRRPHNKATSELGGGFQQLPNSRFITTALDASNVGFYIAEVPGPDLVARVSYADGSRLLFGPFDPTDKAELSGFEDRYGNQQLLDVIGISGLSLPRRLHQGVRRLSFDFSVGSDPTGNSQLTGATLSATVGSTVTPRARLVIDGAGMLTDICAIDGAAPARQCLAVGETTTPCNQPGERTLWRFFYATAQEDPGSLARMTTVMDETCAIVETHDYKALPNGQVVATSSLSASEQLLFSYATGAKGEIQQLTKTIGLRPLGAPATSQEPNAVVSQIHIDTAAGRVKQVDASCGCGPEMVRTWIRDGAGAPRVSVVKEGSRFKSRVEFSRSPGTPTDPHRFGLPTGERRFDETSYASPQKTFLYSYQHPTIRSPTRVIGPGENGASAQTVYDFDDDDEPCVVGFGVTQQRGDPTTENEHPTRFLCRIIETGFSPTPGRSERVTRFKYDTVGRLLKREGPGGDVTTWEYYADDDSDVLRAGMLKSISRLGDAQPLTTLFDDYHYTGQARRVERPNSEVTLSEFDARGRVTRLQEPDEAVTLTSWEADGKPAVTTLPRDNAIFNFWGAGAFEFGRLKRIEWRQSNSPTSALVQTRTFLYDRGGNVLLQEDFPGVATTPTRRVQRDFDESHRMVGEVATAGTRSHVYEDNLKVGTEDEVGLLTSFDFDGFGRLREVQAPENRTRYHYSPRDNLTEVEDGNGNKLNYTWDGFDNMLTASSPDFGTVRYSYTNDGLVESKQDAEALARSESLETLYDGLRRPTVLKRHYVSPFFPIFPNPRNAEEELVRNTWDVGTNALGRLGTVKDEGGTTTFSYDAAGRLEEESHLRTGLQTPLKLRYAYYPGGRLKQLAYPPQVAGGSPQLLNIALSANDEVAGLDVGGQPLAIKVSHFPFGAGLRGFIRGNNLGTQYSQDADGRRTEVLGSPLSQTYLLDPRGLVETVTESGDSSRSHAYGYDGAMRLKHATYQTGQPFSEAYTYDAAGNRLTKVRNGTKGFISAFDLKPGTQTPANNLLREMTATQDPTWRYQYTASGDVKQMQVVMPERLFDPSRPPGQGNPVFVPALEWTYCNTLDGRRRLTQVQYVARSGAAIGGAVLPCDDTAKLTTLAEYRYDAQLRRVYSKQTGVEKHFLFGPAGELLAEVSPQGNVEKAYVWLDGEPYAMVPRNAGPIFYFHNDRMGTPQRLTDEAGKTVWRAEFRPFGEFETVDPDPDKDGVEVKNNLRFAGQYDEGLFSVLFAQGPYYNWNRSYEPATGRYLQPEPMLQNPNFVHGMAMAGMNTPTYAYAANNPLGYIDKDGQCIVPAYSFLRYLQELKDKSSSTYGKDKYAHCMANCIGTIYSSDIPCALFFDLLKESYDLYIKGRPTWDSRQDMEANLRGLSCNKPTPKKCQETCAPYLGNTQHFQ